jgi:N-acetylneuraminic acid mutarotase
MIVWGGLGCGRDSTNSPKLCGDGGAYDPAADRWTALSTAGAPTPRSGHAAVWTGKQMIVWGGAAVTCADGSSGACGDGAAYDPSSDRWTPLPSSGAPTPRSGHAAAWTGQAMFIWGGAGGGAEIAYHDGALYMP